jgi:hypothetical protein
MTISPNLPDVCYVFEPSVGYGLCALKRGTKGFYPVKDYPHANQDLCDRLNNRLGVTKAQREAMLAGSMFGWHIPAADPATYEQAAEGPSPSRARRAL